MGKEPKMCSNKICMSINYLILEKRLPNMVRSHTKDF